MPGLPDVARKAIKFSPRSLSLTGGQSGAGNSLGMSAGIQYWRMKLPIGVPGPTRHMYSFSSALSIAANLLIVMAVKLVYYLACDL
jgi:hypothetical protein